MGLKPKIYTMRRQSYQSRRESYQSRRESCQRRRESCQSTSNVPQSLDIICDESKKQYKQWQNKNSKRWNESSERERRDRLKTCLHNVAQIDSSRQNDVAPQYRASFRKEKSNTQQRRRAS